MNDIMILHQERHMRLNDMIRENITSSRPVLIYCPIATGLSRVKLSNIYIAPDTEGVDYREQVVKILDEQNQIYFQLYLKIKRFFNSVLSSSKAKKYQIEYVN